MKILLFGGSGQVGQEIRIRCRDLNFDIYAPVTSEVDVSDSSKVKFLAQQLKPDVIVNSAGYTAVDLAEENVERAYLINETGAKNTALSAKSCNARLIYLSTDYVYPGNGHTPITEADPVGPLNVYGKSKLAGERVVQEILGDNALIVRTSSVHGRFGNNIVHTILKLLDSRDRLEFVEDQIMSPTWAGWLAESILDLIRINYSGIVHASCSGVTSWHNFASMVLNIALENNPQWSNKIIAPIKAENLPRPAKRPAYSALDTSLLTELLGRAPLAWEVGLRNHLNELGHGKVIE